MKISIGFTGDLAFSEYTKDFYKDKSNLDKQIYSFFEENDYNVINFESPVTTNTKTVKGALAHKSDPDALKFVSENIKNPVLSLANNHMMDFGPKGLFDTLKNLKAAKLKYIGAGKNEDEATNYVILGDEVKVGIISFQYKDYLIATKDECGPAHDKHKKLIKKKIKELKAKTDWVVIVYHGGEEFINVPMPYTRKKLKKMLKWGADIIVAHHPHTVQGYEKFGKKMIFYSLGNFIFDTDFQRAQRGTDKGLLVKIKFTKNNFTYNTVFLKNDREEGKIKVSSSNSEFNNIRNGYRKKWKTEARKFNKIKENKKNLRVYRNSFSISNLHIEKANCDNLIPFTELVKKNNFEGLNDELIITGSNIFVRKGRKLYRKIVNTNYKKFFCMLSAKIIRW